jgi:uncharacterized membrane protein SpoIIM required for sporulation
MREPAFLRQNKDKWIEYEQLIQSYPARLPNPDRLAELYVQLTDDLAYARTFYPRSQTVRYLNGLAARTHLAIYKNKREKGSRFFDFWRYDLPLIYSRNLRFMLYSALFFTFFFAIGVVGALRDEAMVRAVLGDEYVNMTLENIESGDPTGVYKSMPSLMMFVYISFNNLAVAFRVFAMGLLLSAGTLYMLFFNGVMIGAFLTFFHTQGVLAEALPVIYIHGTLEISAIVMAGGSGFMLGNSLLFPGPYTRLQSLQSAARDGVKILAGLSPVIVMAAFLESYITRLTDMPLAAKLLIIAGSLAFVLGYYVWLPLRVWHRGRQVPPQLSNEVLIPSGS